MSLSCPFCGSRKALIIKVDNTYSVLCESCSAQGPSGNNQEECIERWNSRVVPIPHKQGSLTTIRKSVERDTILEVLGKHQFNVTRSAVELMVSRMTLYRLMREHKIDRPEMLQ